MFTRKEASLVFVENQPLFRELLAKRLDGHKKEFRQVTVATFGDVTTTVILTVAELSNRMEDYLEAVLPAVSVDVIEAFLELLQQSEPPSAHPN